MTDDERLHRFLRSALPPADEAPPARDLWLVLRARDSAPTRVSGADLGVAILVGLVLLLFPEWMWFLAYHL